MAKSAYSLILSDEIIRAVDRQAGLLGTNRSALVNRILAESLSLSTPEMRTLSILEEMERALTQTALQFSATPGGAMTLRTALRYKYNPSINYMVELEDGGSRLGKLRVSVRTQNAELAAALRLFFQLWGRLEQETLPPGRGKVTIFIGDKRMERSLRRPRGELTGQQVAEAITGYVSLLDGCMKTFFEHLQNPDAALDEMVRQYRKGYAQLGLAAEL